MSFIVTARKWRPLLFKDVVGQEHVTQTLKNALENDRVHHAYLFSGPRGVGKTTTARILARAINCEVSEDSEPCNECMSCTSILEGKSLDVIEIDGASNNSVDDIRKLRENAKYSPSTGRYKMYVIDEVHMLSTSAFNALLKILEEPPPHLKFVFATTEQHKVPATILSRCQRHEFQRIESEAIVNHIRHIAQEEDIKIDDDSLATIAKKADGSMRDSQSIFDQVVAFSGTDIDYSKLINALHLIDADFYFRISSAGLEKNTEEMLKIAAEVLNKGYDLVDVLNGLIEHYRNLLTVNVTGNSGLIEASESFRNKYVEESDNFQKEDLLRILNILAASEQTIRQSPLPKIKFELCLIQLSSLDSAVEIAELLSLLKKGGNLDSLDMQPISKTTIPKSQPKAQSVQKKKLITKNDIKKVEESATTAYMSDETSEQESDRADKPLKIDLKANWDQFVKKYCTADNGLLPLKNIALDKIDIHANDLIIYTETSFTAERMNSKKRDISEYLREFTGDIFTVKVINEENKKAVPDEASKDNKETRDKSSKGQVMNDYTDLLPVEKAIVELFDAKRIN